LASEKSAVAARTRYLPWRCLCPRRCSTAVQTGCAAADEGCQCGSTSA
jgi:hypothetical protein